MLDVTVHDVLSGDWDQLDPHDEPFCVYAIFEDELAIYVGKSTSPFYRITEHFGLSTRGNYQLQAIYKAYPQVVRGWKIRFYTVQDCEQCMQQLQISDAEIAMIRLLHPCLNSTYNRNASPLPEKYEALFFNVEDNAVDYLDFLARSEGE